MTAVLRESGGGDGMWGEGVVVNTQGLRRFGVAPEWANGARVPRQDSNLPRKWCASKRITSQKSVLNCIGAKSSK